MNRNRQTRCAGYIKWLLILLVAMLPGACSNNDNAKPDDEAGKQLQRVPLSMLQLQNVQDCTDLKTYIKTSLIKQYASIPRHTYYRCRYDDKGGGSGGVVVDEPVLSPSPAPEAGAPSADAGDAAGGGGAASGGNANRSPGDVSDTNNQEEDVHEPDIVKADADGNLYILSGRHFIVADGFPPTTMSKSNTAEIDLGARGLDLLLDKDNKRVVILARYDRPYYITGNAPSEEDDALSVVYPHPMHDYTVALFYDVSAPKTPRLIDQIRLRGYYRDGRGVDGRVHLVSNHYIYPQSLFKDEDFQRLQNEFYNAIYSAPCSNPAGDISNDPAVLEAQSKLSEHISNFIDKADLNEFMPNAVRVINGEEQPINDYLLCSDIKHPEIASSLGLQVVSSVDTDGQNLAATAIVNNSYITYASKDNLYLVENSYSWWWRSIDNGWPASQAAIHQFAISKEAPVYVATGRVDGYVHNQFSLSEYNGALRVATTQDDRFFREPVVDETGILPPDPGDWERIQTNHLSVLKNNNAGQLSVVGQVRGYADNENIRSARFYGDRGYVVTFRNVDPLFTFDLSVPEEPKLLGELIIPGFSSYIHQYDDNTLLTIGRSGGPNGIGVGNSLQLQLIDVTDMTDPKVLHKSDGELPSGWSWSAAEYDHKAFTFYKGANLLAIPMQVSPYATGDTFSGIVAFNVTLESGFKPIGRVNHADLAFEYYCSNTDVNLLPPYYGYCSNSEYVYWAAPRRSVVMTDPDINEVYLFTISDVGIKASSIFDINNTLGKILFPPQPYPWWWYGYIDVGVEPMPVADGFAGGGGISVGTPAPAVDAVVR